MYYNTTSIVSPYSLEADKKYQTPIHDLVARVTKTLKYIQYIDIIENFIRIGYDIDGKNSAGRTALHLAALYSNKAAISALFIAGADINVIDPNSDTAFTQLSEFSQWTTNSDLGLSFSVRCVTRVLALQVIRLRTCGLEVTPENAILASGQFSASEVQSFREKILNELEDAKLVTIGTGSLTLRDFVSETGAVASRPSMAFQTDREGIDKFFENIDNERFPELRYLFKLQYRKMLKRLQLMKEATRSVRYLLQSINGFSIPELCCRMIIRFLTNTEVEHLITSTSCTYIKTVLTNV